MAPILGAKIIAENGPMAKKNPTTSSGSSETNCCEFVRMQLILFNGCSVIYDIHKWAIASELANARAIYHSLYWEVT